MKEKVILLLVIVLSAGLFSACTNQQKQLEAEPTVVPSPSSNAEVLGDSDMQTNQAPSIELLEGQELYNVDINKSIVSWSAKKRVGPQHHGSVKLAAGNIVLQDKDLVQADFIIDMPSITDLSQEGAMKQQLETHLKSDAFFAVEKYPVAELVVTSAKLQTGDKYQLTADLTIKDITKEITFPATVSESDGIITAQANFSIDRTLWDIRYGSGKFFENLGDELIEDEINFNVSITAQK